MPIYRVQAPDGRILRIEGPEGTKQEDVLAFAQQQINREAALETRRQQTGIFRTAGEGISRGLGRLGSAVTDVIPALAGSALGFDEYAQRQIKEAQDKEAARQAESPTLYPSMDTIKGPSSFAGYAAETIGEQIPNIAASLIPALGGGAAAARLATGAVGRGMAERATARGLTGAAAEQYAKRGAGLAAPQIGQAAARGQMAGAGLGSYALTAPEIFQGIYEETGELAPGASLLFGAGAAALDSILPYQIAKNLSGPMKAGIVEKVLERSGMDKGLLRSATAGLVGGVATEGLTEGAQEAIGIAAERFVDDNPGVFGSKEWDRIMESMLRGAVAGGGFGAIGGSVEGLRVRAEQKRQEVVELEQQGRLEEAQLARQELAQAEAEIAELQQKWQEADIQGEFPYTTLVKPQQEAEKAARAQTEAGIAELLKPAEDFVAARAQKPTRPGAAPTLADLIQQAQMAAEPTPAQAREIKKAEAAGRQAELVAQTDPARIEQIPALDSPAFPVFAAQLGLRRFNSNALKTIAGADLRDPAQAGTVRTVLQALADQTTNADARGKIDGFLNTNPRLRESTDVGEPVTGAGGEGAGVAGESPAAPAPGAAGPVDATGVEVAGGTAGEPAAGEGAAPGALTPEAPAVEPEAPAVEPEAPAEPVPAQPAVETPPAPVAETPAEVAAPAVEPVAPAPAIEATPDLPTLKAQRDALLLRNGKRPAPNTKNGKAFDALDAQIKALEPAAPAAEVAAPVVEKPKRAEKAAKAKQPAPPAPAAKPAPETKKAAPEVKKAAPEVKKAAPEVKKKGLTPEQAQDMLDDLQLDPETTKPKVRVAAKRLRAAGLIDDKGLAEVERILKDRDMGTDDALDELQASLRDGPAKPLPLIIPKAGQDLIDNAVSEAKTLPDTVYKGRAFSDADRALLEKGNPNAVLDSLIASEKNPALRQVLRRLRALNLKTKIRIASISGGDGLFQRAAADLLGAAAFKRWFGGSKVVDKDGTPLVVYHGMAGEMEGGAFRSSTYGTLGEGIYFTSDPSAASNFAMGVRGSTTEAKQQGNVVPAYLKMEEPFDDAFFANNKDWQQWVASVLLRGQDASFESWPIYTNWYAGAGLDKSAKIVKALYDKLMAGNATLRDVLFLDDSPSEAPWGKKLIEAVKKHGAFDGIILRDSPKGFDELVVFKPTQIKSVFNQGTFDPNNPDILYQPARGMYDPATDTIYLDPEYGMNAHTFVHEMVHAAISKVLNNRSHPLTQSFEKFFLSVQGRLGMAYGAQDLQEFAAELVSNPRFQALLKSIKTPKSESLFRHILRSIAEFLGFAPKSNAFNQGLDFVNDIIDISAGVEPTSMEKLFLGNGSLDIVAKVGKAMPALTGDTVEKTRNYLSNLSPGLAKAAFGLLRLDNIYTLYKKELPSIKALMDAIEQRAGNQERQIALTQKKYKEMVAVERKYGPQMQRMSDIAVDARLEEVDILNPDFKPAPDKVAAYTRLKNQFQSLPKPVQDVYRTIRDDYDKAFYRHRKILLDAASTSPSLAAKLREQFQLEKPLVSYVPFLRSGDFWVSYTDPDTGNPAAYAFESLREREQFIKLLDQKKIGHRVYQNLDDIRYTSESIPQSSFVYKVMQELRGQGAADAHLDAVWQSYLATFPSGSIMKQFMKSKNVQGMERDIIRGYGDVMIRWARKLANAEYGPQIDGALYKISGEAGAQSDPTINAAAQNILGQAQFLHNPTHNSLTTTATTASYFMFMAGNISSALINMLSLPMMVWPKLVGDFNWDAATRASLAAGRTAMNDWSKTPRYANLHKVLMDHAQLEHTQAREVLEARRQKTSDYTGRKAKALDFLSKPLAITEKYNRAVTAIAAYDLMRGKGASDADAAQYALQTVKDTHTSGMAATGPRWMQGSLGRVFFTFKSFVWNQAFVTARAFHQAFKGEKPEVRAAARRQLLAMYGMTFAFAGMRGMPFYGGVSLLAEMISALFGDDDEPFDFDQFLKDSTNDFLFKGAFNYATNLEIATRAGVANDLLFRDDPRFIAEHGYMLFALTQALGPASSLLMNAGRGYEQFQNGEIERGLETISPSWLRNGLKGGRYLFEGATTLKGDPVMEDIGAYNSLTQMIGFAPADLADRYERLQAAKGYERELGLRRTNILHLFDMARQAGDYELMSEARERIAAFNETNPALRITQSTLDRSLRARLAAEKEMINGVRFNKKLRPVIEERFFSDDED